MRCSLSTLTEWLSFSHHDLVRLERLRCEIVHVPAEAAALARTGGILHHLAVVAVVDLLFVVVDADGVVAMRSARRVPAEFAGQVRALVLSWARRLIQVSMRAKFTFKSGLAKNCVWTYV